MLRKEIANKLDTGLNEEYCSRSKRGFFLRGDRTAFFGKEGTIEDSKDKFVIVTIVGGKSSRQV